MDVEDASKNFFDFKVVDIAMGSGHFLISAIDLIEQELEFTEAQDLLVEFLQNCQKLDMQQIKLFQK